MGITIIKSKLDKSVVMAWVGSPAKSKMSLFLEYPFPRKSLMSLKKNITEAVTRDMAPFDSLKLAVLCLLACKVYLKINPFVTVLGQDRKVIDKHSYLIHSCDNARLQGSKSEFSLAVCSFK